MSEKITRPELIEQGKQLAMEEIENASPDCDIDIDNLAERKVGAAIRKTALAFAEGAMKALEI